MAKMGKRMSYDFDAIRGIQAGRHFYVAMCELSEVVKMFARNEELLPPKLRAQRVLRESRIPSLKEYILNNPESYVFSSLTASVDGGMTFSPDPSIGSDGNIGRLNILVKSKFLINDGQHRRRAIEAALDENSKLENESISVVFFQDRGLKRSQQMFADLNKHAVKPTKSLGILYDSRDDFSKFIVELVDDLDVFHNRTEMEKTSISNRSTKFFTLNGISEATKFLLKPKTKKLSKVWLDENKKLAVEFWNSISKNIPEWNLLLDKKAIPHELRRDFVHSHTNVLNALGMLGHLLITKYPDSWKQKLKGLQKIDWARDSSIWEGKVVVDGRMLKQKAGIKKAVDVMLKECGTDITLAEFEESEVK